MREPLQSNTSSNAREERHGKSKNGSKSSIPSSSSSRARSSRQQHGNDEQVVNFQDVVAQLVDEEEQLLSSHMRCIQKNADLLTEEGVLLSKVQGSDMVDYDIEAYASRLDEIITTKLNLFTELHTSLKRFRKHLALEEVANNVVVDAP